MKITVIGSSNVDMCSQIDRLPRPGETVGNGAFLQAYGGKGANQAVAARRLGGEVCFITAVGDDPLGREMLARLRKEGIGMADECITPGCHTGIALIMIDRQGENCIAVNPGANQTLSPERTDRFRGKIEHSDIVVMQAEIPYETIRHAAGMAHRAGVPVLFNPAPVCAVDDELMRMVDVLVVNRTEAATLSGTDHVEEAASRLHARGAKNVIVTLGAEGAYAFNGHAGISLPAFRVQAVDAVGAGDTFCGALAVAFARRGQVDRDGLEFAMAAAALAVTKAGAQPSIPTEEETNRFLGGGKYNGGSIKYKV